MLGLALGVMGVGYGVQAFSQYQQGKMSQQMYNYNKAVSLRYAKVLREIRAYEETDYWGKAAKVLPKQKVITAAAGLEVPGTPLKVMQTTRQKIKEQARIMEMEKESEIERIKSGAAISGMQGKIAARAGTYGAVGTLLTGGGQLGLMNYMCG